MPTGIAITSTMMPAAAQASETQRQRSSSPAGRCRGERTTNHFALRLRPARGGLLHGPLLHRPNAVSAAGLVRRVLLGPHPEIEHVEPARDFDRRRAAAPSVQRSAARAAAQRRAHTRGVVVGDQNAPAALGGAMQPRLQAPQPGVGLFERNVRPSSRLCQSRPPHSSSGQADARQGAPLVGVDLDAELRGEGGPDGSGVASAGHLAHDGQREGRPRASMPPR